MKIFSYIFGIAFGSIGLTFLFFYTNLFTLNYTLQDYFLFIIKKPECLCLPLGIILVVISLRKDKTYE